MSFPGPDLEVFDCKEIIDNTFERLKNNTDILDKFRYSSTSNELTTVLQRRLYIRISNIFSDKVRPLLVKNMLDSAMDMDTKLDVVGGIESCDVNYKIIKTLLKCI